MPPVERVTIKNYVFFPPPFFISSINVSMATKSLSGTSPGFGCLADAPAYVNVFFPPTLIHTSKSLTISYPAALN